MHIQQWLARKLNSSDHRTPLSNPLISFFSFFLLTVISFLRYYIQRKYYIQVWINWTELSSSNDNSFCNGYTDREESENEKRRKKRRGVAITVTPFSLPILPPARSKTEQWCLRRRLWANKLTNTRWLLSFGNDLTNEKYKAHNLTDIVSCRNLSEISPCVPRSCCELRNS